MKADELMLGDWVCIHEENCYVTLSTLYTLQFTGKPNTIKPIPLTKRVLEKNGFKEDFETNGIYWRPDCRKFCIVKELDTWYFAFRVLSEAVDKSSGYICISECNYVHKLQHILKDLEIEKEIIL